MSTISQAKLETQLLRTRTYDRTEKLTEFDRSEELKQAKHKNLILEERCKFVMLLVKLAVKITIISFFFLSFCIDYDYGFSYYKSIIDKVVNVFTQTDGSAWRVQLIWAFVIVGIWGSAKVVGLLRLLWGIKSDRF